MTQQTLEERVAALEQKVAQLLARSESDGDRTDWRGAIGMLADDPLMREIDEEGRKIRDADRERSRRETLEGDS